MTIGFVTDSTAYLPEDSVAQFGIEVVPAHVLLDGQSYAETDLSISEVVTRLRNGSNITTSRPSAFDFSNAYERLRDQGFDEIVSVHVSSKLSGTYESALLAAQKSEIPVRVIDSSAVAMMMGFPLLGGIQLAQSGADIDDVEDYIRFRCEQSQLIFAVDSIEFLERGGRISPVQARIASRLSVKPLLEVRRGEIVLREIVRSTRNANFKLIDTIRGISRMAQHIAVHHVDAPERGHFIAEQLRLRLGRPEIPLLPIGPAVGAHVGPGAVAVALSL